MGPSKLELSGDPVGLIARNAPDYFTKFSEIVAKGEIVIPLRSEDDTFRREACGVLRVITPDPGFGWIAGVPALPAGSQIAQIAFTSGTQGEPKGVILTRDNLADTVGRLIEVLGMDASIREYVGVPIHHSFGLGRCRAALAAGGRAYVPEKGFDPREIRGMLETGEINAISAVPSLWRIALRNRELLAPVGDRVRWIEIGSQAMSREDKEGMLDLFPQARIVQHYGLTEASRTTFLDLRAAKGEALDTVGAPNGAAEVEIDAEGRIRIRGRHVARELIVGGARVPNVDAEGWFTTRDLGRIEDGNLRFLGRADDMLNLSGLKVSADLIEAQIASALGVAGEICVVRIADPDRGDGLLLAAKEACPVPDARLAEAATEALAGQGIVAGKAVRVARFAQFPVTDTGKIRRFALAEAWAAREAEAPPAEPPAERRGLRGWLERLGGGGRARDVLEVFAHCFPGRTIGPADSFVSLGGDSLTFVEASIALGGMLGDLPEGWQEMTIAELRALRPARSRLRWVDSTILLRCIGIVAIVTFHFTTLTQVGGATFLLLVAAGYNFSRFQVENVLASDRVGSMLVSTWRIALPTWLVAAAIQLRHGAFDPMDLGLVSNFSPAAGQAIDFWFVEVLVQLLLILALAFALPWTRRAARARPFGCALAALAIGVAAAVAGPVLWDTRALYDRTPHMIFWMFALGWALHRAPGPGGRALCLALALVLPLLVWGVEDWPDWIGNGPWWIWSGCLLLAFLPKAPLPFPLDRLVYLVGGASLFIYISHFPAMLIWERVAPVQSSALEVVVALVVGVAFWIFWEGALRRIAALRRRIALRGAVPWSAGGGAPGKG